MIGTTFAALIICALVFGTVLPVLVDRMSQAPVPPGPPVPPVSTAVGDGPSQYELDLRAAIEQQPDNPQPMVSLANLLVAQGRGDEAIQWYERAIELDPGRLQTRLDFGYTLGRRGSNSDAEIQFKRAIAIDGQSAEAHFLLGELYLSWRPPRIDDARASFEQAVAVQPDSVAAERATESLAMLDQTSGSPLASPAARPASPTTEDQP